MLHLQYYAITQKFQTFYGLDDTSVILYSNTNFQTFYGLDDTSAILCSNTKFQTFYGLDDTSAILCSNTKFQTFSRDCGRRNVGRCLEATIMTLNWLVLSCRLWRKVLCYIVSGSEESLASSSWSK